MSLSTRLEALSRLAPLAGPELERVRSRIREPLRVAIAGRVKSGKSTLLNALVGQRLAASDAGECTRIVTWYRDGRTYEVNAVLRDGSTRALPFRRDDEHLQIDLGALRHGDVRRLDVVWPSARLARMILIDTPGLGGTDLDAEGRTRELFGMADEEDGEVDAVIYLMRHLHGADGAFLESFRDASVALPSPANAIAVLSRADEIGAARSDALDVAERIAGRYANDPRVRALCADVVPVAGLLAEVGATLRESEAGTLRAIAEMPEVETDALLLSADRFALRESTVPAEARSALLRRFGLFGVRWAIAKLREGSASTAQDLAGSLTAASGIKQLMRAIDEHFASRGELLKARAVLALFKRVGTTNAASDRPYRTELEKLASTPELKLLGLVDLVLSGAVAFTNDERDEVLLLARGRGAPGDHGNLELGLEHVHERIAYWRDRVADPLATGARRQAAEAVVHAYEVVLIDAKGIGRGRP